MLKKIGNNRANQIEVLAMPIIVRLQLSTFAQILYKYTLAKFYKQYCYQNYIYFTHISLLYKTTYHRNCQMSLALRRCKDDKCTGNVNNICDWLYHGKLPLHSSIPVFDRLSGLTQVQKECTIFTLVVKKC